MRQLYFNKPLLFILITAFLFLQWSAAHIHLAGEHEHDGGQHQHVVTTHQHQFVSHHADVIDVAVGTLSHTDGSKVIQLEHVCTQAYANQCELFAVPLSILKDSLERKISSKSLVALYQQDTYQTYHQYTSVRLRAPPTIS